jgi:hypothetical protein
MLPPAAPSSIVHVTDVSLAPVTVAVNCCVPLGTRFTDDGLMVTVIGAAANAGTAARRTAAARLSQAWHERETAFAFRFD